MRPLDPHALPPVPWKNGGGVTREIAGVPGRWRVSLAEVSAEGPFSLFPRQMRILTVVHGSGMELHTEEQVLKARSGAPLSFSGDLPVIGKLPNGPVHNLNLIFDPRQVSGALAAHAVTRTVPADPDEVSLYLLQGTARCENVSLSAGQMLLKRKMPLDLGLEAVALCVSISRRS